MLHVLISSGLSHSEGHASESWEADCVSEAAGGDKHLHHVFLLSPFCRRPLARA